MIRHFFLDKSTTIVKGKLVNMGMNPVISITYGKEICRALIHFDESDIVRWIEEEGFEDLSRLHFNLRMTNCFSVDSLPYDKKIVSAPGGLSERASSFSLDFFELDSPFDAGRGYEYDSDFAIESNKMYSELGANWEFSSGSTKWNKQGAFDSGNTMIATQHFDFGNENINIDITDYVLNAIENGENNGIGIKMCEEIEDDVLIKQQYVGFFTEHTNTFFHPFIEAIYDDYISDDRECFYNARENRLYLYTFADGQRIKLSEMPTCTIDGNSYPVTCAGKGVYYATVCEDFLDGNDMPIKYDIWSNIVVDGVPFDDIEMEFVVLPKKRSAILGSISSFKDMTVPSVYGINDNEELSIDEVREVTVDYRKKYTTDKKEINHKSEYRVYIKDARREFDILPYQPVERGFLNNFFVINTKDLVPGTYYIDIRDKEGRETRFYKDVLHFKVKDNVTERYY